jgi:hypothetical protein
MTDSDTPLNNSVWDSSSAIEFIVLPSWETFHILRAILSGDIEYGLNAQLSTPWRSIEGKIPEDMALTSADQAL